MLRAAGVLTAAALAAAGAAEAQDAARPGARRPLETVIHERLVLEEYVARIMAPLRAADRAGDGLDAADVEARRQIQEAQRRAQNLAQVMRYDLDADLVASPDEVAKVNGTTRDAPGPDLERFDVDGNGSVTVAEVVAASARINRVERARREDEIEALMTLPEAGDGRLTAEELAAAARAVFARADINGDGRISRDEAERFRAALPPEPARPRIDDIYCPIPPADTRDLIVVFGAYEGEYTRALGVGQTGRATVHIAPGRQPIYLVLPSYAAIRWTLTGAVERVRQAVVTSNDEAGKNAPRGIDGLPEQRVRVFRAEGCVRYFSERASPEADAAKAAIALRLGRPPDVMAAAYSATTLTLPPPPPAETAHERPEAAGPPMRLGAWRFSDEDGDLSTLLVRDQTETHLLFRVGGGSCLGKFRWWREGPGAWRFRSRCGYAEWEQVAEGRVVGDFQTSLSFTARVVSRGFKDPADNGETTVRVQAQYVGPES